ncbi:MAG: XisI protein [Desulfococcaceae bacterium]|jgi:hypothetical protein|nr:XisI protein [Desulfococcaceae bacterium]
MANTEQYDSILKNLVRNYAAYKPSHGQIESKALIDPESRQYEVLHVGWDGDRRVHGSILHLEIRDGKIWIQYDGTSPGIAEDLLKAGIPKESIVLGFHPAPLRKYTGFSA